MSYLFYFNLLSILILNQIQLQRLPQKPKNGRYLIYESKLILMDFYILLVKAFWVDMNYIYRLSFSFDGKKN